MLFDFIQYAIDTERQFVPETEGMDWFGLYKFAEEQAILGVLFKGVERLGEQGVKPPFELLMQWIATAEQIKSRNKAVNKAFFALFEELEGDGFRGCVLKGQGNNLMYPNVYFRTPGDIDVWMKMPEGICLKEEIRGIIRYVRQHNHHARAVYHHIDFGEFNGVEVEAHYRPTFMNNLITNRRLQRWMKERESEQLNNLVSLPGLEQKISVP